MNKTIAVGLLIGMTVDRTFYHRLCFFTTSDAKSTCKFVKILNESLECGLVMCQDAELDKYVMNITTRFCRSKKENLNQNTSRRQENV